MIEAVVDSPSHRPATQKMLVIAEKLRSALCVFQLPYHVKSSNSVHDDAANNSVNSVTVIWPGLGPQRREPRRAFFHKDVVRRRCRRPRRRRRRCVAARSFSARLSRTRVCRVPCAPLIRERALCEMRTFAQVMVHVAFALYVRIHAINDNIVVVSRRQRRARCKRERM